MRRWATWTVSVSEMGEQMLPELLVHERGARSGIRALRWRRLSAAAHTQGPDAATRQPCAGAGKCSATPRNLSRNLSWRRTPSLVSLVAIAILVLFSEEPATKSNALGLKVRTTVNRVASKIPEKWKKEPTTGRPRACGVIEKTVGFATRVVLLGGGGTADDTIEAFAENSEAVSSCSSSTDKAG